MNPPFPGGQFVQQGYSAPQVLNQPIGGAPTGQPWYPPPPNAARGVHPNQYVVAQGQPQSSEPPPLYQHQAPVANQIRPVLASQNQSQAVQPSTTPGQPQPSEPPPPYQHQAPVANQIRPVIAGQNQSQAVQPSTTPCAQPPSIYQPLITQNNQTPATQIQPTNFTSDQAQRGVRSPLHQSSGSPSNPTHTYAQTIEQSSSNASNDGSYLEPNNESSSPPENTASGIDSGAYECIEELSYDYANPEVALEIVSPAGHYVNDSIAKRPKAKRPK